MNIVPTDYWVPPVSSCPRRGQGNEPNMDAAWLLAQFQAVPAGDRAMNLALPAATDGHRFKLSPQGTGQ